MKISKQERESLIRKISKASGIAQYALKEKMTDDQVIKAAEHLDVFLLLKGANNYNRHCQKLKTQEANQKLKAFLNPDNSELLNAGKWLLNAFSKTGHDRKQTLLEKDLVHKDDYNSTVVEMGDTITTMSSMSEEMEANASEVISELEKRVDILRSQLSKIKDYITFNYGADKWNIIKNTFDIN